MLFLSFQSVRPAVSIVQAKRGRPMKHETFTQCWTNVGPPSTMLSQHAAVVGGYRVMFGATLNVGQRHRWRANSNPALFESIVLV